MPRRLALIAVGLLLASPAVAQPGAPTAAPTPTSPLGIARCTWAALPATTRAALIASGPSIDNISDAVSSMNPTLMQLAQSQCPAPTNQATADATKDAWAGTVMTNWSEGELAARFHVTRDALARAWSHVPPAARRQIGAGFDQTPGAVRGNVAGFAAELRLADPVALDLLSAWAIAQVRLAALT